MTPKYKIYSFLLSPLNGIRRSPHQQKSVSATVDDVSWLSFISFTWMFPWMWRAYRGRVSTSTDQAEAPGQWDCSIFDSANVNLKRFAFVIANKKIERTIKSDLNTTGIWSCKQLRILVVRHPCSGRFFASSASV
jgi:hypothetical protein